MDARCRTEPSYGGGAGGDVGYDDGPGGGGGGGGYIGGGGGGAGRDHLWVNKRISAQKTRTGWASGGGGGGRSCVYGSGANPVVESSIGEAATGSWNAIKPGYLRIVAVTPPPTLTLTKALAGSGRALANDQFTVEIRNGATVVNAATQSTTAGAGAAITAGTGTTGATVVAPGVAYTLFERMAAGSTSTLNQYSATLTCTGTDWNNVALTGLPNGAAYDMSLGYTLPALSAGAKVSCTLTNTPRPAVVPAPPDPIAPSATPLFCHATQGWINASVAIPNGVSRVKVVAVGGGGGGGGWYANSTNPAVPGLGGQGGAGAEVIALVSVTPGQAIPLSGLVGGGGGAGKEYPAASGGTGGWAAFAYGGKGAAATGRKGGGGGGGGGGTVVLFNDAGGGMVLHVGGGGGGGGGGGSVLNPIKHNGATSTVLTRDNGRVACRTTAPTGGAGGSPTTDAGGGGGGGGGHTAGAGGLAGTMSGLEGGGGAGGGSCYYSPAAGNPYHIESVTTKVGTNAVEQVAEGKPGSVCIYDATPTTLTLTKALAGSGRALANDQFTVEIRNGATVVNAATQSTTAGAGAAITAGTGTTGATVVAPGVAYTLFESMAASGTGTLNQYSAALTCAGTDQHNVALTGLPNGAAYDMSLGYTLPALSAGAKVSCTLTNTPRPATIAGNIFADNGGAGGLGAGNNGIQDGAEVVFPNATVNLTNCAATPTVLATATTDGGGNYAFNAAAVAMGAAVCVEVDKAGFISTGASLAGGALPAGYAYTRSALTTAGATGKVQFTWQGVQVTGLNMGLVAPNTFTADASQTGGANSTIGYAHRFKADTDGTVKFSLAGTASSGSTAWNTTRVYEDLNCNGSLETGEPQVFPPLGAGKAVKHGDVCVIVSQAIPASAVQGDVYTATLSAAFDYANANPALSATHTVKEETTVALASVSKAFSPTSIIVGQSSELTFTLTHSSPTAFEQSGLGFTDTLPAGLVLAAGTSLVSNTCGGSVTAVAGTGAITLAGGALPAAAPSCAITVRVTTPTVPVLGGCSPTQTRALTNKTADVTVTGLHNAVQDTCLAVRGGSISGMAFADNGAAGTGIGNNGVKESAEGVFPGITMKLTNCAATPTVFTTATSGSDGRYSLDASAVPANTQVCVEADGYLSTGASLAGAALPAGYTYARTTYSSYRIVGRVQLPWQGVSISGLNFGAVWINTFTADSSLPGAPGATVTHAHVFTADTDGSVRFSVTLGTPTGATWAAPTVYEDTNCNGSLDAGETTQLSPVPAGAAVPVKTLNGGGKACIVVRQPIPASIAQGDGQTVAVNALFDYRNAQPPMPPATYAVSEVTIATVGPAVLSKAFSPARIIVGQIGELSFKLTNSSAMALHSGLGFTDTLPAGIVLADNPLVTNTCGGTVTAAAGSRLVTLASGTMSTATCVLTVRVTTPPVPVLGECSPIKTPALTNKKSAVTVVGVFNGMLDTCLAVADAPRSGVAGGVFLDDGAGGGIGNNGIREGGEAPLAGVQLRLTDCAAAPATVVYASGVSDGVGRYMLDAVAVPANAMVCVEQTSLARHVSTGASLAGAALSASYTYVRPTARGGSPDHVKFQWQGTPVDRLDFGDVIDNTFAANGQQQGVANSTVTYAHTFTVGTTGKVVFSVTNSRPEWAITVFDDPLCTGKPTAGAPQLYPPAGVGKPVSPGDKVCIVVRQFIPATASPGESHAADVGATFDYFNASPALPSAIYTLNNVTTVGLTALSLRKEVRNVTVSGPFGISNQAKPGDELEYRITYTNNAAGVLTHLVINDTTPAYTTFVSSSIGTTPTVLGACTKNTPANPRPAPAVDCTAGLAVLPAGGTGEMNWVFDGTLEGGASGDVLFRVKVD
ncbi:MAG: hypothetical protein QM639_08780 [Rhodocyclaceae bacterium]